jgi:hypothetical protein
MGQQVNENHVHDLGKMLFGFSIFWTYLWFDQFMLQWYANVPEETHFWYHRFNVPYFKLTIFGALIINFLFPLFFLIKRGAKRNFRMIGFGAALLIFGHYVDFFNYTFVEPNWNGEAKHHLKERDDEKLMNVGIATNGVVLFAQADKKHGATDATPVKENTEAVTTEVHNESNAAQHNEAEHGAENGTAERTTEHGETVTNGEGHETDAAHGRGAKGEHVVGDTHAEGEHGHGHGEEAANFAGIGLFEIMVFIGFLGLFLYMFFNNLAKRPIVPEDDPYLKECEKLEVVYS